MSDAAVQALSVNLTAVERVLARTPLLAFGEFRCPVEHPQFAGGGPQACAYVVFPRHPVRIRPRRGRDTLCSSALASYYNVGDVYDRQAVSPAGDHCDWIALAPDLLASLQAAHGIDADGAFAGCFAPVDARAYAAQRRLFEDLRRPAGGDRLALEERTLAVLGDLLVAAHTGWRAAPGRGRATPTPSRQAALVAAAEEYLAARFVADDSLDDIARDLGCSVAHLSRTFRAHTGCSLHAWRDALRLREASHRLPRSRGALSALALDLGYSSHSHFGAAFRREFGSRPSTWVG